MASRPEFIGFDVDGARLGALRWEGLSGAPTIVAVHGITANAWTWDPLAHHLAGAAHVVAIDLRGRGRSVDAPEPFGMRQHGDDIAAVIEQIGGPLVLVGHSMGTYAILMAAERHPGLVSDLVLVDGGTPLGLPPGESTAEMLETGLGPVIARLRTVWPDRVSYQAMWSQHPAFVDGISPDLERNLLADLVEVDGGFRAAVNEEAVVFDGGELFGDDEVRTLLDRRRRPTAVVRAEFGLFGTPPPLIPVDVRDRYRQHHWIEAPGLNHYTIVNSAAGASLVADTIRTTLTATD